MNENEKGKEFYIGTLRNLKEIYENWGTDIMSLYEEIKEYYQMQWVHFVKFIT